MSIRDIPISKISESDLNQLTEDQIRETKYLEYKQCLQLETENQKQEFLSDITALANSDGGDILYGVAEEEDNIPSKGAAKELVGLKNFIKETKVRQIENLLRDSVQPRLSGCQFGTCQLENKNVVLIVRVPRSFAAPHMVRHQGVTRFCGRNSNGKYDLDVQEIRTAFLASETMSEKIHSFRLNRINKLLSGEAPVPLNSPHLVVLHILPLASVRPEIRFNLVDFQKLLGSDPPRPILSLGEGYSPNFNCDGYLIETKIETLTNYTLLFRNGYIESVDCTILSTKYQIPNILFEKSIIDPMKSYLNTYNVLNIPPPYIICLSLLNVRNYVMLTAQHFCIMGINKINQDHILSDEILIESTSEKPETLLRPIFDHIWNACGLAESINYDKNGNWNPKR